jgi:hypothetical protein
MSQPETLTDANDLAPGYASYRQTASADDVISRARARVLAQEQPAAPQPQPAQAQPAPGPGQPTPTAAVASGALLAGAGTFAKDVAGGVREIPMQALGGVSDAVNRTFRALDGLANWLNTNVADLTIGDGKGFNPLAAMAGPDDPTARGVPPAKTVTGGIVREGVRFLAAFLPASRAASAVGMGATSGGIAAGAVSDFLTADPNGERLADLWKKANLPENVLTDWLAQTGNEENSDVEKRFKNAIEGAGLGAIAEGVTLAARAVRSGMQARTAATGAVGQGVDELATLRAQYGTVNENDFKLLGDPAEPLISVGTRPAADPKAKVSAGMAATETSVPTDVAARGLAASGEPGGKEVMVNFARINTPDDVKSVIGQMADAFAGDIDQARRGVQSNEETARLASELGMSVSDLLSRRRGEPLNAEQSLAARQILNQSATKLLEIAQKAAAPTASSVDQFQFRKMMSLHYAIQAEVVAARTETARALQAWAIPAGLGGTETAKAVGDMLTNMGGPDLSRAMAQRLAVLAQNGTPPEAINAVIRKSWGAASMDAVKESFVMGLLWSPTTHIVNSTSNVVTAMMQVAERSAAAGIGETMGRAVGEGVAPGEAMAMTYGLVSSLKDAFRLGGQALVSGTKPAATGTLDMVREPAITAAAFRLDEAGAAGRVVDFIGHTVRIPGHLLAGQDAFFQTIGYRMELHAQAFRQAASEGLQGPDASRRMAEIVHNPPENIKMAAADAALYNTFNKEPGGFAQKIMQLRNYGGMDESALAKLNPLFLVLPFVRTPANVLSYTFERTPLAPLVGQWRADIAAGGARADLAMARLAMGSTTVLLAADLAANGLLTGAGPTDAGQREALTRNGWQPYSIKVGDTYAGYNRVDPFGMIAGFASTMQELTERGEIDPDKMDEWNEVVAGAIHAVSATIVDKTFFSGVASLFEVLGDPNKYTKDYVNQLVGSLVPFTSALGFAERSMDPSTAEVNSPWDAVMARIPGLSASLTTRRNLWGDEIKPQAVLGEAFDVLSPVRVSQDRGSPIDAELSRLNYGPARIPKKTSLNGANVNMGDFPEAYDEYVRLAGNELKHPVWGLGARDFLNAVVTGQHEMSAIYKMGTDGKDGGKSEFIRRTIQEYRSLAQEQVLNDPRFVELRQVVDDKRERKEKQRMPVMQ